MEQQQLDKVNLVFQEPGEDGQEIELPMRMLVLSDLTQDEESEVFEDQEITAISKDTFSDVLAKFKIKLHFDVANQLVNDDTALRIELPINSLDDFSPLAVSRNVSLIDHFRKFRQVLVDILSGQAGESLDGFLEEPSTQRLLSELNIGESIDTGDLDSINQLVAEIDFRLGKQIDAILHNSRFRELESAWKSLQFLVERVDFAENIQVLLLNVSKQALLDSFEDAPEVTQSALFEVVHAREFGQFGGRPYSFIIGNYEFGPKAPDIRMLQDIAAIASMSHCPFIAAAGPELFGIDTFSDFARIRDLASNFEQPAFVKWNSFRETPDAKYIGLTVPKFKLRDPYGASEADMIPGMEYRESFERGQQKGVWGNSAFAFASRMANSFAATRWCLSVIGSEDGRVEGLEIEGKASRSNIPVEVLLSDRRESELVSCGFIPLSVHKGDNQAAFYSANSTEKLKDFPDTAEGRIEAFNNRLAIQLPYLMIVCRFSHYLKVMQRENIGSWKTRPELERELNGWLRNYVSDMDNPAPGVRARRPLRNAKAVVREIEGKAGWFASSLSITPHVKYMGESFTLKETGKLDRN